jgi:hypothetical protein
MSRVGYLAIPQSVDTGRIIIARIPGRDANVVAKTARQQWQGSETLDRSTWMEPLRLFPRFVHSAEKQRLLDARHIPRGPITPIV